MLLGLSPDIDIEDIYIDIDIMDIDIDIEDIDIDIKERVKCCSAYHLIKIKIKYYHLRTEGNDKNLWEHFKSMGASYNSIGEKNRNTLR